MKAKTFMATYLQTPLKKFQTMKFRLIALIISATALTSNAQINLNKAKSSVNQATNQSAASNAARGAGLSNDEVIRGLKEALSIGTKNAAGNASVTDGFFKNALIKIPFPKEVKVVETEARRFGMGSQVDKFVMTMNRAAEEASKEATPVFVNAVKTMGISDGLTILRGGNNAATTYLQGKTSAELTAKFSPIVKKAIAKVQLTKYWKPIITAYNRLPMVRKQNPDLDKYVTERTLAGLFLLLGQEEAKIRKDPVAQVTNLLQRVFGGK